MTRERVNAICKTLPGAEVSDPWDGGYDAWKVGGKMFACVDSATSGVSIKTESVEAAEMLIEAGIGRKAPYFHRSWINVSTELPDEELRHRIIESYRIIRSRLTKKMQASLDPIE
ncbi:MAG: MmcQ/YjbR family DNA-binding protein [Albidovulum sp.]|nr:MmcQ/YjbR family DNA-binding protein [Albidovulum sp.]MDE0308179.1 MmcQ/YjbR family DNA-binding protein [Albidovulum sp.]MDE0532936.1 MmcQ/YjbR family DNA-binding protein [Albidovulum sp.]